MSTTEIEINCQKKENEVRVSYYHTKYPCYFHTSDSKDNPFLLLFYSTVADVVPCGGRIKSPPYIIILQVIFYFRLIIEPILVILLNPAQGAYATSQNTVLHMKRLNQTESPIFVTVYVSKGNPFWLLLKTRAELLISEQCAKKSSQILAQWILSKCKFGLEFATQIALHKCKSVELYLHMFQVIDDFVHSVKGTDISIISQEIFQHDPLTRVENLKVIAWRTQYSGSRGTLFLQDWLCDQRRLRSACASCSESFLSACKNFRSDPWLSTECPAKILISLRGCAGWFQSSLGVHAIL